MSHPLQDKDDGDPLSDDGQRFESGAEAEDASEPARQRSHTTGFPDGKTLTGEVLAAGRLEVLRRLGEGGTGVVYEALDRVRRERVAVKTLARLDANNIYRLKREFRSLAGVVHPNLVALHELFCESGLWFFTMDLVHGQDFVAHVRDGARTEGPVDDPGWETRLRDAFGQLVAGVDAIHRAGKLHCDLKPSNVLVTARGQVRILDFGLVVEADRSPAHLTRDTGLFGTPDYISPERVLGSSATAASDWYAVGVVLFEALTGSLPFGGDRFLSLQQRAYHPPPFPGQAHPKLPADLAELCMRLMQPQPDVRATAREVFERLGAQVPAAAPVSAARPQPPEQVALVGRERELAQLDEALRRVERGRPVLVTLPGLSGMGKSALMTAFADQLRADARIVVLAGRCYERESVPYKTLDSVIDQLARFWRQLPAAEAAALLPRDAVSLVRIFPVLSRVDAIARAPQREVGVRDPQELRRRAFRSLRELFGRLGDRYTVVVLIDDLQWGDRESARELVELLAPPDPPCLLVLCAYRADEVHAGGPLQGLLDALESGPVAHTEVPVGALGDDAAHDLARRLTGAGSAEQLADLVREAEGSPFFMGELVRQGRQLARGQPLTLADVVRDRLRQLTADERLLLDLLVVSPGPVRADVLREVSKLAAAFDPAMRSLLGQSLVRSHGGRAQDQVEPFHDRIRETVAGELTAETRVAHHAAFAEVLRARGGADPEVMAAHLEGAGQPRRAADAYARAAQLSLDALAFDHAASLLRRALSLGDDRTGTLRAELSLRLAEALAFAGRGPEAAEAYQAAAEQGGAERRDELRLRAAEQLLYAGHNAAALALLREVLPRLGLSMPKSRLGLVSRIAFDAVRLAPRQPARLLPPEQRDAEAGRKAALCATLGDAVLYVDFGLFAYFQQRHVLHGLASGEPGRVAQALTTRAMLTASPAPHRFGSVEPDLKRATRMAEEVGDPEVRGRVAVSRAIVYSAAAHYLETEQLARQAEAIFRGECQGVKWGLQLAVLWQSVALFYLGRFLDLSRLCREHLPQARARGDLMLSKLLSVWLAWAELAAGKAECAMEVAPEPALDETFTILDGGVVTQRGPLLLYLERVDEAWQLFEAAAPRVRDSGILRARTRAFEFHWTRGLAATHLRANGRATGAQLNQDIRELASSRTPDSLAMAEHLRGARAGASGDRRAADYHWTRAADGYAARHMEAFEATLRLGAAHVRGQGEGFDAKAAADHLAGLGVSHHAAWLSLWCPGWDAS